MVSRALTVGDFARPAVHWIDANESLATARQLMNTFHVRHLPVLSGGQVIGILSERDLYVVGSFPEINFAKAKARFAMTPDPYIVSPAADLATVVRYMHSHRIGSVLLVDGAGHLSGIFTDTDALSALAVTLRGEPSEQQPAASAAAFSI